MEDKGQRVPEGSAGEDNQVWTWEEPYGAVHQGDCEDCTRYSRHLRETLGNDVPSAIVATNYPSAMARHEFDRGWDAYEHAEVYSEWAVTQKELRGDNVGPHYEVVYCTYMCETADGEASPEGEAHTLDSRGNYPNRAPLPHGHLHHKPEEDYGPSFLYNGLAAEAVAPRAPQAEIDDEWGWTPGYSVLHTGPCDRCEGYQQHLATAIGIGVPSVVTCHDRFLPVGHWFKGGLRVEDAASHRGCCGCAATRRRGEWTRECPTRGKVPRKVREVFSTGVGSEASELSFARKC